ncbi:MAG: DUF2264 domain-containing protein [Lachnospiraceae bacterium]|nr:DUF2264 domain-containing protein [Lachnospiraceae bacterium]
MTITEKWKTRSLKTRNDVAELLLDMVRPLKPFYSAGHARLKVGNTGAHYGEQPSQMEGFARIIWGLGPLWAGDNRSLPEELQREAGDWLAWCLEGIIHGTDPEHEEYWGRLVDFDQMMVEMAALVTAVSLSPDKLWEPLSASEKENLYNWLNQINQKKVHPNNWRFFRILVNMTFRLLNLPYSEECLKADFDVIEGCYTGEGWYYDGNPYQMDYYIPFAMEFYGLIYANRMEKLEPERCAVLKKRAAQFSEDFVYWFGNDGNELPYGRSLTYRFAHSAFFSAMGFAGVEGVGYGVMKHLVLKNLENWVRRPIFDNAGVLTIGYGYPNLFMSERYNAPGSPYWSFKCFLMLAMDESHPFWQAEEKEFDFSAKKFLEKPHMLVSHTHNQHVLVYPSGQKSHNNMGATPEKYGKFVYSNQFAFSVSRGYELGTGAFDNTLAAAIAGTGRYQMRDTFHRFAVTKDCVTTAYPLMPGVEVVSRIVPCGVWHVRIHQIDTCHPIDLADGGFALRVENKKYTDDVIRRTGDSIALELPWGISKAVNLTEDAAEGTIIDAFPNTNLLYNLTSIPALCRTLEPGTYTLISAFMADSSAEAAEISAQVPKVRALEKGWEVSYLEAGEWQTVELGE